MFFQPIPKEKRRKTIDYDVFRDIGGVHRLGQIIYFNKWRQHVWFQEEEIIMSYDCLQDVVDKIKELNANRRKT